MIPQSARQFNERLVREDKLNDRYSDQLNQINWFIIITLENFIKLIYVWDSRSPQSGDGTSPDEVRWVWKTRALLIDWQENLWEILNALVKRYGVSIQENA